MPRIKNPKANQTYGLTQTNNALTFRERLLERFQPHEFVRVINCDFEPVTWQYLPSHAEEIQVTSDPMKIVHRGEVEVYMLNPGESEVLLGECAYLMIDVLYKQIVAHKTIEASPNLEPGQARNFNYTDPLKQEELIDKIFLGKESPNFASYDTPKEEEKEVENVKLTTPQKRLREHLKEQTA